MSALTKNERDGLEDVFLSIHSNQDKYKKIKDISSLVISKTNSFSLSKLLKQAKYGLNETNFSNFFSFFIEKEEKFKQINYKVSIAELFRNYGT